ncbi:phage tail assembly chaperone [Bacillus badius]|uniref:Phage-like element PBSX protein xkdN n=1 Tax=Bacillus badius TaxID=1455 RepID=A0ABR5B2L3_BACBA|nr:phage portal protein [Bacillus badius]KIL80733.1 Phage-like element PBSX protein xkdN [Bacillus badius]MED4715338.1 phage portal protein [Bacillus badius]
MTNQNENVEEVAMDLSFFMPGVAKAVEVEEWPISKRFVDKKGKVIPFKFKAITTERIDELEKESMKPVYQGKKKVGETVDTARFYAKVAIESTIYPNFKAAELRKAYKTEDPVEVAKQVLHIGGEYANWVAKAVEINGFDDTPEDLEEAAKN